MQTLSPTAFLKTAGRPLPPPLDGDRVTFWFSARTALWQAIAALDLPEGGGVAVPAFCCGSELEPFVHAGLQLRPYTLGSDLAPDSTSFEAALDGACAALVTHYFGFPSPLEGALAACDARSIPLIEDCAHALYAEGPVGPVGSRGAAACFSMWKSLPLPDGGALRLAKEDHPLPPPERRSTRDEVRRRTRHLLSLGLQARGGVLGMAAAAWGRRRTRHGATAPPGAVKGGDGDPYEVIRFRPEYGRAGMSRLSWRLFRTTDHAAVRRRRRDNFALLAGELAGVAGLRPLFPVLSPGASPLFFPVVVDDPPSFRHALAAKNVGAKHVWPWFHPQVAWEQFPREAELKRTTLGLPVHQELTPAGLDRLIDTVRHWGRSR